MSIAEYKKQDVQLTPDGLFYLELAKRGRAPLPYSLRWLMPFLVGENLERWARVSAVAISTLVLGILVYAGSPLALPFLLLAPCMYFWYKSPVLVDAAGVSLSVWAAIIAPTMPALAILIAVLSGFVNEKAPLFGAIYASNPLLLIGLAAPAATYLFNRYRYRGLPEPSMPASMSTELKRTMEYVLRNPLHVGLITAREIASQPFKLLAPAGGMALAVFAPSTPLVLSLIAAAAMSLVATDKWRQLFWVVPPALACVLSLDVTWVVFGWMLSYLAWPLAKEAI